MTFLEEFLADLHSRRFLKEFSFRKATFIQPGTGTLEVADHVVWINDLLFLFQVKDRESGATHLIRWLERKVIGKATKQIRTTIALANSSSPVSIANDRGIVFDFRNAKGAHAFKLILHRLPQEMIQVPGPRFHVSTTVGFIHVLNWIDYLEILKHLVTPIEIADYLAFRESTLHSRDYRTLPSEGALLGQYFMDEKDAEPDERYAGALFSHINTNADFDLTWFFDGVESRIVYETGGPVSYYRMLGELARLSRTELGQLKQRLIYALDATRQDRFERPYRITTPRTDCGFLIIPLTRDVLERRLVGLANLTRAAKYDQHTSRQVGISIVADGQDFLIDWAFLEGPWQRDANLERLLQEYPPFRPLRSVV